MISVIVPVYNRIDALKRALDSIANQTYKDVEVIVVDDGSSEKLQIQNYKFQNNIPVLLLKQENMGAPAARNRGLAEAKGEYVIFWDADVIAAPQMLEKLKQALDENPKASFAYCNHVTRTTYHVSKKMSAREFDIEQLRKNNYIHSTSLIRREAVI
ncbi:glycosyltransferase family 2 protein, partial [Candidatus Falkowbacteria bacterium]|nr:glycosyltransferase family 2 protein [Candidatus Falkowbacteria bacterium]